MSVDGRRRRVGRERAGRVRGNQPAQGAGAEREFVVEEAGAYVVRKVEESTERESARCLGGSSVGAYEKGEQAQKCARESVRCAGAACIVQW